MSDNLNRKFPEDPTKININQKWELNYWSKKFGVSQIQLISAVNQVGYSVAKVKEYLGK
ncbi:DUF3606 domain-containing protein [Flammeovirgaceae bacterium SG7u.111]|nr:DUF3606 domain-containing protein [Flammeovirgaceae bacterium SG7u.132]WPO38158.1 DUF3606 domain-containing protein [Flammeovirgaceae bacterium SG7u.111]